MVDTKRLFHGSITSNLFTPLKYPTTKGGDGQIELVVFVASLKFFFIEGGEQFIVGIQTAKSIGLKPTLKITLAGVSFAVILFFLLFYSHVLIPTRWLEMALAITLYFLAATMFKEVIEKDCEEYEFDEKTHKYGYITIVSLESIENATVLAALSFIDISGALIGAVISIAAYITLAVNSKQFLTKIPLRKLRLISGILLTITATPLLVCLHQIGYTGLFRLLDS